MASDITLAVGDDARRMTYAELATVRGISLPSARRLVLRHHWPRQAGNDGIVRVTVPLTALVKGLETEGFPVTTTDPLSDCVTVTLSLAVDSLREQLAIANGRADRAERRIDKLLEERREERQSVGGRRAAPAAGVADRPAPVVEAVAAVSVL